MPSAAGGTVMVAGTITAVGSLLAPRVREPCEEKEFGVRVHPSEPRFRIAVAREYIPDLQMRTAGDRVNLVGDALKHTDSRCGGAGTAGHGGGIHDKVRIGHGHVVRHHAAHVRGQRDATAPSSHARCKAAT